MWGLLLFIGIIICLGTIIYAEALLKVASRHPDRRESLTKAVLLWLLFGVGLILVILSLGRLAMMVILGR